MIYISSSMIHHEVKIVFVNLNPLAQNNASKEFMSLFLGY